MNTLIKSQLKPIVFELVEEALNREMMKIRAALLPYVSNEEQEDIEKRYKKPSGKTVKTIRVQI